MSVTVTARPRGSEPNTLRLEQVGGAALGQRPGGLLGGGHVLVGDVQVERAGVPLVVRLGPHAAERAAQPGGELLALLADLPRRSRRAAGQPGQPAGPVAHRPSTGTMALSGSSRSALFISAMPSAPSARTMTSMVSLSTAPGTTALVTIGLSAGPADPRQHRHGDGADRQPQQRQVRGHRRGGERQGEDLGAERRSRGPAGPRGRACAGSATCRVVGGDGLMPQVRLLATHHQASCANAIRATPTTAHHDVSTSRFGDRTRVVQRRGGGRGGSASAAPCGCPARCAGAAG